MMQRWGVAEMCPVPGAWNRLVAFQVPLFNEQLKKGWGYTDLLGVTEDGLPVVIELKKGAKAEADERIGGTETPLRMVLEAAAYAIALRKNWDHRFRKEWIARLIQLKLPDYVIQNVPDRLNRVPLVAVAPASFWIELLPVSARGKTVTRETWASFQALLVEFEKTTLPVSFVSLSGNELNPGGLVVQPLVGFPPKW